MHAVDLGRPAILNAMCLGACAPDLMNGVNPVGFHTGLVHYVKTGGFARHLVVSARSHVQRAFAWGWVSHVIADARVHPIINRHAERIKLGRVRDGLSYADDPVLHTRLETGVDVHVWNAFPDSRDAGFLTAIDDGCVELVRAAMRKTHGLTLSKGRMKRTMSKGVRLSKLMPLLLEAFSMDWYQNDRGKGFSPSSWIVGLTAFLAGIMNKKSGLYALTHPLKPSEALISDIRDAIRQCLKEFNEISFAGVETLVDRNLDTGRLL